ncbi:hypothetical protein Ancab_020473 [Ancistrocladus abbreviatus]
MEHKDEETEAPIYGDLLEAILSHVPLINLVPACLVSKSWHRAVLSSLSNFNRVKPWLLVHNQGFQGYSTPKAHAYDPRSHAWVEILQPSVNLHSTLRSSNSNLVYALSSKTLSFSLDPLHVVWHQVDGPRVWRVDPLVALVGSRIVVAGGGGEYEDDPLVVEMYDIEKREWVTCQSMPGILKDSAASTRLSVASDDGEMFVTEKTSGMTYTFSPDTKTWSGPYDLRPAGGRVFSSTVGFSGDNLILAGVIGLDREVKGVKLWRVERGSMNCIEIAEMPVEMVEKLKGERGDLSSISISATDNLVCLYKDREAEEVVMCEFGDGGACEWGSVRNAAWNDKSNITERVVLSCGRVEIGDLQKAFKLPNVKLVAKLSA